MAKVSAVDWGSRSIKRMVRSSLAAEVCGLSTTIDAGTFAQALWLEMTDGRFKLNGLKEGLKVNKMKACHYEVFKNKTNLRMKETYSHLRMC